MTRDEVLREFGIERDEEDDCLILPKHRDTIIKGMADEIVRLREQLQQHAVELLQLRERLAAVEESREILKAYYEDAVQVGTRCASILAALREPSEAVGDAFMRGYSTNDDGETTTHRQCVHAGLRAAVAAAEREAQP